MNRLRNRRPKRKTRQQIRRTRENQHGGWIGDSAGHSQPGWTRIGIQAPKHRTKGGEATTTLGGHKTQTPNLKTDENNTLVVSLSRIFDIKSAAKAKANTSTLFAPLSHTLSFGSTQLSRNQKSLKHAHTFNIHLTQTHSRNPLSSLSAWLATTTTKMRMQRKHFELLDAWAIITRL